MTGYSGRVGIYEILLNSPEMRKMIRPNAEMAKLRDLASREGMRPLRISGALKVAQGLTSLEEVTKVAPPADEQYSSGEQCWQEAVGRWIIRAGASPRF